MKTPLSAAPEPKRRFVPSKHEAKRVAKMVRLIREGKLMPHKPAEEKEREEAEKEEAWYDVWSNEEDKERHAMHMPAPKLPPPEHDLSINPPEEYVPSKEEREAWENQDPEDRAKSILPTKYDALRKVPAYMDFTKERFERCLDLYLAPRVRKTKLNIDPMSLLPKLPRPEELKPFPTVCQTTFSMHDGRVRSISTSPNGDWV
ncbi:hypothetical protein IMZ48_47860, partial [Candidatus Bathyarchaeota archaeon]|nr:hypothetical protein [Candidatus Bathyarchaeota archaeon]